MLIPSPLILALQKSIDTVLTLDPALAEILKELAGHVVCLHFRGLDARLYLIMQETGIEVVRYFDGDVDTTLSGTPLAMASMTRTTQALFKGEVEIHGNMEVGKQVKKLMGAIDVAIGDNWEEQLSHVVGDTMAHQMGRVHRSMLGWLSRTGTNVSLDMGDYLTEEKLLLAPVSEISRFCAAVDDLRADTDRLEARLNLLTESAEDTH